MHPCGELTTFKNRTSSTEGCLPVSWQVVTKEELLFLKNHPESARQAVVLYMRKKSLKKSGSGNDKNAKQARRVNKYQTDFFQSGRKYPDGLWPEVVCLIC